MLDEIDRAAEREGFALDSLRHYNNCQKRRNGKSNPKTGRIKLPDNTPVDVVRILKILKSP
jgi:hypothetical protein